MSKLLALLALLTISACATRTGKIAGVVAGASTVLAVTSFASSCDGGGDECEILSNIGGAALLGVAGISVVIAAIAEAQHSSAAPTTGIAPRPDPGTGIQHPFPASAYSQTDSKPIRTWPLRQP